MPEYTLKASVDVAVTADTPQQAKRAAFELLTSCRQEKRRGRPTGSPVASVTGVTIGCDGKYESKYEGKDCISELDLHRLIGEVKKTEEPVDITPLVSMSSPTRQSSADAMEGSES